MDLNKIAEERCEKLLQLAREIYRKDKVLSKRYAALARKIAMRHRFSLGRKEFCRKCGVVFIPGTTLKVRTSQGKSATLYICLCCNNKTIFPYTREKYARKTQKKSSRGV